MKNKSLSISESGSGLIASPARALSGFALSKRMFADIAAVADITLVAASAFLIKYLYVNRYLGDFDEGAAPAGFGYASVIGLVSVALYFALRRRKHYSFEHSDDVEPLRGFIRLSFTVLCAFGIALSVLFFLKASTQISRVWFLGWCSSAFLILFIGKMFWTRQFERLLARGYFRRRVLLFGAGDALERAKEQLLALGQYGELAGVSDLGDLSSERDKGSLSAAIDNVIAKGQSGVIDEVIIAMPATQAHLLDHTIRGLRLLPVDLKLALDLGPCQFKLLDVDRIGATNLVRVQKKPISEWNSFLKATEDYVIASLALIVFLPAMAIIAVLVKLDSPGPVLFRQRRHGSNHKVIEVWKFRTMTVMEDGDKVTQASKNDNRITRIGRILRKTSLDELPQLFNVLFGDMSLVGPRPHALTHNDYYSKLLEDYASRHRVKPGITGWAQIHGFRGEITAPNLMEKRVHYDLEYIDNWSIWLDLQILFLTPLFGFVSKSAY
jgi:putative colanic acid biosysnthesis UDP-glucose lipid carrier transferase